MRRLMLALMGIVLFFAGVVTPVAQAESYVSVGALLGDRILPAFRGQLELSHEYALESEITSAQDGLVFETNIKWRFFESGGLLLGTTGGPGLAGDSRVNFGVWGDTAGSGEDTVFYGQLATSIGVDTTATFTGTVGLRFYSTDSVFFGGQAMGGVLQQTGSFAAYVGTSF